MVLATTGPFCPLEGNMLVNFKLYRCDEKENSLKGKKLSACKEKQPQSCVIFFTVSEAIMLMTKIKALKEGKR